MPTVASPLSNAFNLIDDPKSGSSFAKVTYLPVVEMAGAMFMQIKLSLGSDDRAWTAGSRKMWQTTHLAMPSLLQGITGTPPRPSYAKTFSQEVRTFADRCSRLLLFPLVEAARLAQMGTAGILLGGYSAHRPYHPYHDPMNFFALPKLRHLTNAMAYFPAWAVAATTIGSLGVWPSYLVTMGYLTVCSNEKVQTWIEGNTSFVGRTIEGWNLYLCGNEDGSIPGIAGYIENNWSEGAASKVAGLFDALKGPKDYVKAAIAAWFVVYCGNVPTPAPGETVTIDPDVAIAEMPLHKRLAARVLVDVTDTGMRTVRFVAPQALGANAGGAAGWVSKASLRKACQVTAFVVVDSLLWWGKLSSPWYPGILVFSMLFDRINQKGVAKSVPLIAFSGFRLAAMYTFGHGLVSLGANTFSRFGEFYFLLREQGLEAEAASDARVNGEELPPVEFDPSKHESVYWEYMTERCTALYSATLGRGLDWVGSFVV